MVDRSNPHHRNLMKQGELGRTVRGKTTEMAQALTNNKELSDKN